MTQDKGKIASKKPGDAQAVDRIQKPIVGHASIYECLPSEMSTRAAVTMMGLTNYLRVPTKKEVAKALLSGKISKGNPRGCGWKTLYELKKWAGVEMPHRPPNARHIAACIEYLRRYGYSVSNTGITRES